MMQNYVTELLKHSVVNIKFKKVDGTIRDMRCSLKEDVVKPYERKTLSSKEINTEVQSVYDVEKQAWRSFRWDNVISFNVEV